MDASLPGYYRTFCNKMWQAMRYFYQYEERFPALSSKEDGLAKLLESRGSLTAPEKWILSRLSKTVKICQESSEHGRLFKIIQTIDTFFWKEFCDFYLEFTKSRMANPEANRVLQVYVFCFSTILKLLHPIMPFITEELYHRLPDVQPDEVLLSESFPDFQNFSQWQDSTAENDFKQLTDLISGTREVSKSFEKPDYVTFVCENSSDLALLSENQAFIQHMCKINNISFQKGSTSEEDNQDIGNFSRLVTPNVRLFTNVTKKDLSQDILRLQKQKEKLEAKLNSELEVAKDPNFMLRVSSEIQNIRKEKREKMKFRIEELTDRVRNLRTFGK